MRQNETLNITVGTDVILHVSLEHDGVAIDPSVIEDLTATLVSGLGKESTLTAAIESDYIVVSIPWVEGRLPGCHSLKMAGSINGLAWACVGKSLIRYTAATEAGAENVTVSGDVYDVTMDVGYHYTDSPINEVEVTVDGGVGTPTGDAEYAKKKLTIHLHDIKGEKGDKGDQGIQGIQGTSAIWDGDAEVLTELEHSLGSATNRTMSQKGINDALTYGYVPIAMSSAVETDVYINSNTGKWDTASSVSKGSIYAVEPGETLKIVAHDTYSASYAWLQDDDATVGETPEYAGEMTGPVWGIPHGQTVYLTAPADANFIYILSKASSQDCLPQSMSREVLMLEHLTDLTNDFNAEFDVPVNLALYSDVRWGISGGNWVKTTSDNNTSKFVPIVPGQTYYIESNGNSTGDQFLCYFLTNNEPVDGEPAPFAYGENYTHVWLNGGWTFVAPQNARYLLVRSKSGGTNVLPTITQLGAVKKDIMSGKRSLSILYIGNSLTQDGVAYLPTLLGEIAPDIDINIVLWYNGGYTLTQQYNDFTNGAKADIVSLRRNAGAWINNQNSRTIDEVLACETYDIIVLQEYMNYQTEIDVTPFNNCLSYIREHYGKPFKVGCLLHPPKRDAAQEIYARTVAMNLAILKNTDATFVIDTGAAIMEAMNTSLDSLGDHGHLSPDGTHTQEGLPCLRPRYVHALWKFRMLGIAHGVSNSQLRVTQAVYDAINVPGPNLGSGVITGTDDQHVLAQLCAIKADKIGQALELRAFGEIEA